MAMSSNEMYYYSLKCPKARFRNINSGAIVTYEYEGRARYLYNGKISPAHPNICDSWELINEEEAKSSSKKSKTPSYDYWESKIY